MPITKEPKTFRLSVRTIALLARLAEIHDTTQTRIIEEAIREKARREKIQSREETGV